MSSALHATHGGPGWRPRDPAPERDRERWGGRFGVDCAWAPLREVLLAWPGEEMGYPGSPRDQLMFARPDLDGLRREVEAVAEALDRHGVAVHLHRPARPPPPNFLFQADLFFMTPEGAVLARMASEQRAGEEPEAARALAALGVPILRTVRAPGTFEGADAAAVSPGRVILGVGLRTDREGAAQVRRTLEELGLGCREVPLRPGVQHLMGAVVPLDEDLAVVRADQLGPELRDALGEAGLRPLVVEADEEVRRGLAMNVVPLGPRAVLAPGGCRGVRRALEGAGVEVFPVDIPELRRAAGGLGCLVGVLRRERLLPAAGASRYSPPSTR